MSDMAALVGPPVREPATEADLAVVEAQLGRKPRGTRAVAHRCPCGLPDVVETTPVVWSRIEGTTAVITVRAGSLEDQASRARTLEAILLSGPLPAPVTLVTMQPMEAPVDPATLPALVVAAALVFIASLVSALWLTFRRPGARPTPA